MINVRGHTGDPARKHHHAGDDDRFGGHLLRALSSFPVDSFRLARPGSADGCFQPLTFSLPALTAGAAVATLSYLGFDAVSTLAEESKDPRRDLGVAIVSVCLLQTVICFLVVYLAAVVWPEWRNFQNTDTAILDISSRAGGPLLFGMTTIVLLVAAVASSIASQASAARLLFGMGRDGILPPAFLPSFIRGMPRRTEARFLWE